MGGPPVRLRVVGIDMSTARETGSAGGNGVSDSGGDKDADVASGSGAAAGSCLLSLRKGNNHRWCRKGASVCRLGTGTRVAPATG